MPICMKQSSIVITAQVHQLFYSIHILYSASTTKSGKYLQCFGKKKICLYLQCMDKKNRFAPPRSPCWRHSLLYPSLQSIVLDVLKQAAARNTVAGPSPLQMSSLQYPLWTLSPDHFSSALDMQHVRIKATASRPRRAQTQFPVCKKNIRMEVN